MRNSFSRLFLAPLAVLVLTSVAVAPLAEAQGRGGGGAGARSGGGGAHAAGGGGAARQNVQANNSQKDVRTNDVRNTSVNNVNVNVNTNVNVNVDQGGCCHGGWDNDYHPVATAAAVTRNGSRDVRDRRLDRACAAARVCSGQLRRNGLSAVRQYLVSAARWSVRGDQPTVLMARAAAPRAATLNTTPQRASAHSAERRN